MFSQLVSIFMWSRRDTKNSQDVSFVSVKLLIVQICSSLIFRTAIILRINLALCRNETIYLSSNNNFGHQNGAFLQRKNSNIFLSFAIRKFNEKLTHRPFQNVHKLIGILFQIRDIITKLNLN